MARLVTFSLVFTVVTALTTWYPADQTTNAQTGSEATIQAQQTEISDLRTTVAELDESRDRLRTRVTDYKTKYPIEQSPDTSGEVTATHTPGERNLFAAAETAGAEQSTKNAEPEFVGSSDPMILAEGLELLNYHFVKTGVYRHDGGEPTTVVFGEIRNTTDQPFSAPSIRFVLIDGDEIVGEMTGFPVLDVIMPDETVPIQSAVFGDEPTFGSWSELRIELDGCWGCDYGVDAAINSKIEMRDVNVSGEGAEFKVTGKLYNGGDQPVRSPKVVLALYLPDGRFTGSIDSIPPRTALQPGESVSFEIPDALYPIDAIGIAGTDFTYKLFIAR